ncbi:MAG: DUF4230 domain-containing protein [Prevotella sp.]|nr:DUF4230 domain-containing protein [Prevotella sp.]
MPNRLLNELKRFLAGTTEHTLQTAVVVIVVIATLLWGLKKIIDTTHIGTVTQSTTISSPTSINSIKDIGEWEFLTINNEELVDTVRRGLIGSSELIRIYYGTLRLGINLNDTISGWLNAHGDTIDVVMPRIKLLDTDFIDEARTEAFYETGKWSPEEMNSLYKVAKKKMIDRCMTKENIEIAQENAKAQMYNLLNGLGYNTINIQ